MNTPSQIFDRRFLDVLPAILALYVVYSAIMGSIAKSKSKPGDKKPDDSTFITYLIMLIIINIFAAVIIPSFFSSGQAGIYARCSMNCKEIGNAVKAYAADNEGLVPDELHKIVPRYIDKLPGCPLKKGDTYSASYAFSEDHKDFTIFCDGGHEKVYYGIRNKGNWPQYSSKLGLITRPEDLNRAVQETSHTPALTTTPTPTPIKSEMINPESKSSPDEKKEGNS